MAFYTNFATDFFSHGFHQKIRFKRNFKGEVRRKINFRYVSGFVVLRDVVKVFLVSSSSLRERRLGGIEHEVTRGHDAA